MGSYVIRILGSADKARGDNVLKAAGISDQGKVRENNEDRYLIYQDEAVGLFAVADGMGGHAAGEVASSLALETVRLALVDNLQEITEAAQSGRPLQSYLTEMMSEANAVVLEAGNGNAKYNGMGTTVTLVLFIDGQFWLAHIGDSRAYRINAKEFQQLTVDHTLVSQLILSGQITEQERDKHPQRNILTQALGTDEKPEFDIQQITLSPNERILLCTDGLCSLVNDEELFKTIQTEEEPDDILVNLVDLANERGGTDNITAVLVHVS